MGSSVPPEKDIGPFYKAFAGLLAGGALILFLLKTNQGRDLSWIDLWMFLIVVMFVLALWRPDKFDSTIKAIADKLPFLQYKKEE